MKVAAPFRIKVHRRRNRILWCISCLVMSWNALCDRRKGYPYKLFQYVPGGDSRFSGSSTVMEEPLS